MPRSTWFKALLLLVALWAPLSQAETGWQPIQETIRKSDKDNRQYQAIRLDNGMVVDTGNHEQLLARCDIYREVFESQRKGDE